MWHNTVRVLFAVCGLAMYSAAHADVVLITAPKTVGPTDTTITATAGGSPIPLASAEIIVRGTTLTMNGRHTIQSLTLERSTSNVEAVLTHTAATSFDYSGSGTDVVYGLNLTTTGSVFIQGPDNTLKASRIDLLARGYLNATGPGAGISSAYPGGGGHGGAGRNGLSGTLGGDCIGSFLEPAQFGSGGGNDTVGNTASGGRGGGALRMTVGGTFTVDGAISANGENYTNWEAAGGAGGSLWITCGTLAGSGLITSSGGTGSLSSSGGGGGGRIAIYHTASSFSGTFDLSGGIGYGGTGGAGTLFIKPDGARGTLYIDNADKTGAEGTEFSGVQTYDVNLLIRNQGVLSHKHQDSGVELTFNGDAAIESDGFINLNARGYLNATGPGAGISSAYPGGGGHGGAGRNGLSGTLGGDCNGSFLEPAQFGSGGGNDTIGNTAAGGRGGGALRLIIGGTLTLDGVVSANGENYTNWEAAGGSGGSLWIACGTLAGTGLITSSGGTGNVSSSGGGGGGRAALYHTAGSFNGVFDVSGGVGYGGSGGAGTFYIEQAGSLGTLYIDNADKTGAEGTEFTGVATYDANLVIRNQGVLSHKHQDAGVELTFNGDAAIESDGFINLNARGYPNATGPGAGISSAYPSGGGHGGAGRNGAIGTLGGDCNGSFLEPAQLGSGGGNDTVGNTASGGRGGGALRLTIGGTLTLNGVVSANGENYTNWEAAGGSGGSLWITCGTLAGTGLITSSGGTGNVSSSGGGGGGRVALYHTAGSFSGTFDLSGGIGYGGSGGAGTFYIEQAGSLGTLYVDNADKISAEGTEFTGVATYDANLVIRNQGVLSHKHQDSGVELTFNGDAAIESDGFINLNARGYPNATGPGAGISSGFPGGGGHGGKGGKGAAGTSGGTTYGDAVAPLEHGSGGGNDTVGNTASGGRGGGALRFTVGGTLVIDGTISASGENYTNWEAAGGAGGSLWITCGTLAGTGLITTSGGAGNTGYSGGGGGGRIAIYSCDVEMLAANITAPGGSGWQAGQPGSVYFGGNSVQIFLQPDSATYVGGQEVSLVVDAAGDGPLTFQWYREGAPLVDNDHIFGSSTDQLTFSPIECDDGGLFYCLVTDACGSFPTDPAFITVLAPSDYDGSGFVDTDDFTAFVTDFELGIDKADFDGTGFVDTDDFTAFVLAFEAGC